MKKLSLLLFAAAAFGSLSIIASAKVGDIAGTLYPTDILTQVDELDMKSYTLDGKTMIALLLVSQL